MAASPWCALARAGYNLTILSDESEIATHHVTQSMPLTAQLNVLLLTFIVHPWLLKNRWVVVSVLLAH